MKNYVLKDTQSDFIMQVNISRDYIPSEPIAEKIS
jgi:hypothetical protein